jgi:hypothetical protein
VEIPPGSGKLRHIDLDGVSEFRLAPPEKDR